MGQTQDICTQALRVPIRDPGSFRDPSGFVCHIGNEVFRVVERNCGELMEELARVGLFDRLHSSGSLILTRIVQPREPAYEVLRRWTDENRVFLHHHKVPFITYPYEWSSAMLADAAVCCLDLQLSLIQQGYCLKDASAYNVQFLEGRPVFIDVASIERARRRDVWAALDQFQRMFLHPLLLTFHRKCSLKEYFLSHLDGLDLADMYDRFGFPAAMKRSTWFDIWLPYQLQRLAPSNGKALHRKMDADCSNEAAQFVNLSRLKRKVQTLASRRPRGRRWIDYSGCNGYADTEATTKVSFIDGFLRSNNPKRVLDIGCNTGRFSEMAAQSGASVVAIDADHDCIDSLYRRCRDTKASILPLVVDIASPSPGIGFNNKERPSFLERSSFDCVFTLALVHHLLVTARLPLECICDLLADLTSRFLVIEFVGPGDAMFETLLGAREPIYSAFTFEAFMSVFQRRFELIDQTPVGAHRKLVSFRTL